MISSLFGGKLILYMAVFIGLGAAVYLVNDYFELKFENKRLTSSVDYLNSHYSNMGGILKGVEDTIYLNQTCSKRMLKELHEQGYIVNIACVDYK